MSARRGLPDDNPVEAVTWEAPPPRKPRYDWPKIATKLQARPMEWAKVFEGGRTSQVNAIRQGSVAAVHPDLGFELRTTDNVREPVRTCTLWMRFNPDKVRPLRKAVSTARKD